MPAPLATPDLNAFETLVAEALETLPDEIVAMMENITITVAEHPTLEQRQAARLSQRHALYGLYQGIPLTRRGSHYGLVPPDRITIFMIPMVYHHRTPAAIREQVRRTVLHEIGHHFGMGEAQLRRLGY